MGKFLIFAVVLYVVMALALLYGYLKGWKITTCGDLDQPPSKHDDAKRPKVGRDQNTKDNNISDPDP